MINYRSIANAIDYYEKHCFARVETPWLVSKPVSDITKPEGALDYMVDSKNKVLVASGEQGFLYQYKKGFLPKGRFQTVTPCFRDETFDSTHCKYFMKLELIDTYSPTLSSLDEIVGAAKSFFYSRLEGLPYSSFDPDLLEVVATSEESYDILYPDVEGTKVELGSYGIRTTSYLSWVYGTGIAEPRLSQLMEGYR
jgi:hypothetical protein